jgi:hypothetical protein
VELSAIGTDEDKKSLLKGIGEHENEIRGMKTRIPPHSVRYEMVQL